MEEVSTIKALLNLELERARTKKLYDVFSTASQRWNYWKMYLSVVNLTRQNCRLHICLLIDYDYMARAASVRFTLQHAPHRVGMTKRMLPRQTQKW